MDNRRRVDSFHGSDEVSPSPRRSEAAGGSHVCVELPPLFPEQAVMLVDVLEMVISAIWRAHGDAMADYLGRVAPDSMPRPYDAVWSGNPYADDDDELDF